MRLQETADDDDKEGLPACNVAAAMHSASAFVFEPLDGDYVSEGAAAVAAKSLGSVVSDVQYRLRVQMSWLRKKGRQLDSDDDSSSSGSSSRDGAGAASMQQTSSSTDDGDDGLNLWRHGAARWIVDAGYVPLDSHCALFARKFTAAVVNETLAMALSCAGLGLGSWCSHQQWLSGTG
jgi:hypothetical protein